MKIENLRGCRKWPILAAAVVGLVECTVHTDGVADLIGDGLSYVEFPGHRVVQGVVSKYDTDVGNDGSPVVVAIGEDGTLTIAPMLEGASCKVGPASDLRPARMYLNVASVTGRRVSYLHDLDSNGWGTLSFVDHSCKLSVVGAFGAQFLDLGQAIFEPPRFLAKGRLASDVSDGSFELLVCDPSLTSEPCTEEARVIDAIFRNGWLWTIEQLEDDFRIVARDRALNVTLTAGANVTQSTVGVSGEWAAFVDSSGLHVAHADTQTVEDIAMDACQVDSVLSRSHPIDGFVYRSPCSNGTLYLYDTGQRQAHELAPEAALPVILEGDSVQNAYAYYLTSAAALSHEPDANLVRSLSTSFYTQYGRDAPPTVGTLAITKLGGATRLGPANTWLAGVLWQFSAHVTLLSDFDGLSGKLAGWDFETNTVTSIASGVTDFASNWAILVANSGNRQLSSISNGSVTSTLVERVVDRGVMDWDRCIIGSLDCATASLDSRPAYRQAILSNLEPNGGTLWLLSRASSNAPFESPELLDNFVDARDFRFLRGGDAVLYLMNFDQAYGAGALTARFVKTMDAFTVGGVRSWKEVVGNNPGILYSSVEVPRAGLWFARLR